MASTAHSPIVGILCMDVAQKLFQVYGDKVKSYVAASYVKFVESAGAKIVPIWIGKNLQYYEEVMSQINGILIPGGAVYFNSDHIQSPEQTNKCVQSSKFVYEIARRKFQAGEHFPILGVCLGFELLVYHSANGIDLRQDCARMECSLAVEFENDFKSSKLFERISPELVDIMRTEPFSFHLHRYCITKSDLINFEVSDQWKVLATNKDPKGLPFVSIVEHIDFPFYGLQFHPEKVTFEHSEINCSHSVKSMMAARYFAEFFVSECRKNFNRFPSVERENECLIWNFPAAFTGRLRAGWEQCYLFDDHSDYCGT